MEYNHPKLFVSHLLSLSVATLLVKQNPAATPIPNLLHACVQSTTK